jgi:tRNA 2-selenouridine synthase SelU
MKKTPTILKIKLITMKKFIVLIGLLCLHVVALQAQNDGIKNEKKQEKIKALYAAYITQQLNLTEVEAQKFWPIHSQFQSEIKNVKKDLPVLERQQTVLNIKKQYQQNFSKILGAQRTEAFFKSDAEFKLKLLNRMRKKKMMSILKIKNSFSQATKFLF